MRALSVAATGAALVALLVCSGSGAALPLAPLSSLGHLTPAPAPGVKGPEVVPVPNAPILDTVQALKLGQTIDGIKCQASEKVLYHVHAHLTIFVAGKARQVPFGIGIGPPIRGVNTAAGPFVETGSCFAWLHTHAADGVIHIESPVAKTYTLGDFFDIWGIGLSNSKVGPDPGKVTAFYDGRVYTGNVRDIPLTAEAQIQLDIGAPLIAPEKITFPAALISAMKK